MLAFAAPAELDALAGQPISATVKPRKDISAVLALIAVVAILLLAGLLSHGISDPSFSKPPRAAIEGVTIFAVFYAAAQAVERLLEPLSQVLLPKEDARDDTEKKAADAQASLAGLDANGMAGVVAMLNSNTGTGSDEAGNAAANVKATAQAAAKEQEWHTWKVIVFWTLATTIAMWASATLHLYFLRTIGVTSTKHWLEILATGLIIGSGTKPLHDLIDAISAKSDSTTNNGTN
jgi:hypothetical protein